MRGPALCVLLLITGGCSPAHTAEESVSGDIEQAPYREATDDRFQWNAYQRIPKPDRKELAPLQKEWLDLINAEMDDLRKAYAAKNAVSRDVLLAESRDRQIERFKKLQDKISSEGLNNWAMTMSEGGLVFGPVLLYRVYRTHVASRDLGFVPPPERYEPTEFYKVEHRVEDGFLFSFMPEIRSLSAETRTVLAEVEPGQTVFLSLPPGAFQIWMDDAASVSAFDWADEEGPAIAAHARSLRVLEPEYLRIAASNQSEVFEKVAALRQARLDAETAKKTAEERREQARRDRRIAELKREFVERVYRATTKRAWANRYGNDWEDLHLLGADSDFDGSQQWGTLVKSWILDPRRGRESVDPYATTERDSPPRLLDKLARLNHPLEELLADTRIAFVTAGAGAETTAWEERGFSRSISEKMQRFVDPAYLNRKYYEGRDAERAAENARAADDLLRYDEHREKYLVRAAELPRVKYAAMEMSYWTPGGHPEMRLLAELAVAWERGDVVIFEDDGSVLELGEGGLAAYLTDLAPQAPVMPGVYYDVGDRPVQIDFACLQAYMAAVRAGREPANLLRVSQEEYRRRADEMKPAPQRPRERRTR
jgi:hypothetical protein